MIRRSGLCAGLACTLLAGCYQGDWKIGLEVPVGTRERLLATRDVERWELEQTPTPFVVRLRADLSPRCRSARFGSTRRTDVGRFRRTGGQYWRGAAIATGILGGVGVLTGGSGWLSRSAGGQTPLAMYTVGGLVGAGGIVSCILAIQKSSPARWALCGSMLGTGAALALGAGLSQIGGGGPDPMDPTKQLPLIGTNVFQGMTYGGAAALGVAGAFGITAALWKGETERTRVIESPQASLWDRQQGEQTCGPARPLIGRTATLEISAERAAEGAGSEAEPLKLRVAVGEEGVATVDLRPLRQSLPSCGVLRISANPDTLYEQFNEDYLPQQTPQQALPLGRPIHGRILPPGGITLQGLEGKAQRQAKGRGAPGFAEAELAGLERRCRVELARGEPGREAPREAPRDPRAPRGQEPMGPPTPPSLAPGGAAPGQGPAQAVALGPPGEPDVAEPPEAMGAQAGHGGAPGAGGAQAPGPGSAGGCAPEMRQTIQRECEHSCGRTLEAAACVFERRKCMIDARASQQKQRDQELCDLAWEKCLFRAGVGPGAWSRCADACQKKNEASMCRPE